MDETTQQDPNGMEHGTTDPRREARTTGQVVHVPFGRRRAASVAPIDAAVEPSAESRLRHPSAGGRPSLRIDCGECAMEGTDACADCVMSFVVNREPGDALVLDVEEARAWHVDVRHADHHHDATSGAARRGSRGPVT